MGMFSAFSSSDPCEPSNASIGYRGLMEPLDYTGFRSGNQRRARALTFRSADVPSAAGHFVALPVLTAEFMRLDGLRGVIPSRSEGSGRRANVENPDSKSVFRRKASTQIPCSTLG